MYKNAPNVDMSRKPAKLPTHVWSALGSVPVVMVERKKKKKNARTMGHYRMESRHIEVEQHMAPIVQHQTLWHEWVHMVLCDAGLHNAFTAEQQEVLADVIGTARAAELLHGHR